MVLDTVKSHVTFLLGSQDLDNLHDVVDDSGNFRSVCEPSRACLIMVTAAGELSSSP